MSKARSKLDYGQTLTDAYYDDAQVLGVMDGFITAEVGRKVVVTYPTATTEVFSFQQGATVMFVKTVTYTDATKASISSVERTT